MAHRQLSSQPAIIGTDEHDQEAIDELIASLPITKGLVCPVHRLYQNFWCPIIVLPNVITFRRHFKAKDKDIVLVSQPKSGTTKLKALAFSVINRSHLDISNRPLLTSNPHEVFLSSSISCGPTARLFATHIPYPSLTENIKRSDCWIIYICRNPLDTVEHFETFCQGQVMFGPFWDHITGYWKESLERPRKVLFLKYEDLKEDIAGQLKKVAEFVGLPFTEEEEEGGDLEVNKSGKLVGRIVEKRSFFRKGEVGDWVNHLTPSMVDRLNSIIQEKMRPFGLEFKMC
ncbi:LOW QUALITY PROTEIN: cytosolic sulfotransferase 15-like [Eucalyptus grandis]|uniref:LOW QUALITY PROTEIN: cytosolic sulfotransferase 15-like n=1 Tax=Eucalyptus grandis TaxID=71139 RepID=UPI00192E868E|nr:LOW QUALITY PROTEIN: cytosolic sulfotransferase 15-like [Eucalyptus grandis]